MNQVQSDLIRNEAKQIDQLQTPDDCLKMVSSSELSPTAKQLIFAKLAVFGKRNKKLGKLLRSNEEFSRLLSDTKKQFDTKMFTPAGRESVVMSLT